MVAPVSVVIPTWNRASLVPKAVESVLAQTSPVAEILIVDDGSTDDTAEVVRRLPGPVRYLHKRNGGAASARNLGIREARNPYIALLDSDDVWRPDKIERQCAVLDARPNVVVVHSAARIIGPDGRPTGEVWGKPEYQGWVRRKLLFANGVNASSVLARREAILQAGGYDERFRLLENWELWLRMSKLGEFAYQPECLVEYRRHDGNTISDLDKLERAFRAFHDKHLAPDRCRLPPPFLRRVLAHHHRAMADAQTGQGRFSTARKEFLRSLQLHPWQPDVAYRLFRVSTAEVVARARSLVQRLPNRAG